MNTDMKAHVIKILEGYSMEAIAKKGYIAERTAYKIKLSKFCRQERTGPETRKHPAS